MPVRIYDISKKLGLENKEVLTKAKALGIAAKVASSSLDKITAEYLEQQLIQDHPNLLSPPVSAPVPAHVHEPIQLVTAPPPEVETARERETSTATATGLLEPEGSSSESIAEPTAEAQVEPEPAESIEPPVPLGPKVGDKVGFVQLPPKPGPKPAEKPGGLKLPPRPIEQRRTDFNKRGDIRS